MKWTVLLGLGFLCCASTAAQQETRRVDTEPLIWAGLQSGAYNVGVDVAVASGDVAITYWYPASAAGEPARLRDFTARASELKAELVSAGVGEEAANGYLDAPLRSKWRAKRSAGRFPLILIAQGNGQSAFDQAVLSEFLATHGFTVATTVSPTVAAPMRSEADVPVAAQRQAEDLLNIERRLEQLGIGDTSRTAAIGHSLGARGALLLAMHDSSVKALVSLDGGIGTASAIDAFKRAPWFSLSRPLPPVLHLYESADPFMTPDFSLLRALRSPNLVLRELTGLHHVHFSTLGFQASRDGSIAQLTNFGAAGTASLRAMAEEVRKFLQVQLSVSRAR